MIGLRVAAFAAGLGEYGWAKVFLTEFGPMQRFAAMLTDYELEPDPIFTGKICDRCVAPGPCAGNAISRKATTSPLPVMLQYAKIDLHKCGNAYRDGNNEYNPSSRTVRRWRISPTARSSLVRHQSALEGARGCVRECYVRGGSRPPHLNSPRNSASANRGRSTAAIRRLTHPTATTRASANNQRRRQALFSELGFLRSDRSDLVSAVCLAVLW